MKLEVYIDGASRGNPGPGSAAVYILRDGKPLLKKAIYLGKVTNNYAEYSALLMAVDEVGNIVRNVSSYSVEIFSDSELLVRQINGQYRVKSEGLKELFAKARLKLSGLKTWRIAHVPREMNREADRLANMALDAKKELVVHASA